MGNNSHRSSPRNKIRPYFVSYYDNDACKGNQTPYYKYVDDLTFVESRKCTQQSHIQRSLVNLQSWTTNNNMKLNAAKCHSMTVCFSNNIEQPEPVLCINDVQLRNVQYVKVLGVIIQDNLKWDKHVGEVIKKCNRKLYMFRCLRSYNLPMSDLLAVYKGYIRPVLDYCVPVFNGNLTQDQVNMLERVQRRVCRIILGKDYSSYKDALS